MKITEVTYEQVGQLKPYETMRVSVKALINEGESEQDALNRCRDFVQKGLKDIFDAHWAKANGQAVPAQPRQAGGIPAQPRGGVPNF
jgi:hypothetical protein